MAPVIRWQLTLLAVAFLVGCPEEVATTASATWASAITAPASTTPATPALATPASAATAPTTPAVASRTPAAVPASGDPEVLDLVQSRALLHLFRPALVINLAGAGFAKYSQEYTSPWGKLETVQGREGRLLSGRAATLRFPWWGDLGTGTVTVRVIADGHRRSGKPAISVNGKRLGLPALASGWQEVSAALPAGLLRSGENELVLGGFKKGTRFHSIEIGPGASASPGGASPAGASPGGRPAGGTPPGVMSPGTSPGATPAAEFPPVDPLTMVSLSDGPRRALTGFSRVVLLVEAVRGAVLECETWSRTSAARFRVEVRPESAVPKVLLDQRQAAGARVARRLPLDAFAGELVALELLVAESSPADAVWLEPRIVFAAAKGRPRPRPVKNAILLVVDALRADRAGFLGPSRVRTPRIAAAARRGVVFPLAQAASPSSPPAHASIQSGMTPRAHGVGGDKSQLTPGTPLVSALLGKAGLATGYFGNNGFGMNRLRKASNWTAYHQPAFEGKGGDCGAVVKETLAFARHNLSAGKRFFVSALPTDTHTPYRYRQGITEHYFGGPFDPAIGQSPDGRILGAIQSGRIEMTAARWAQLWALYDSGVEKIDGCLGQLLDGLEQLGALDQTAVILTSDHGDGFLEHQKVGHAFGHWGELTNIPMLLLWPGLAGPGHAAEVVVSHLDLVPTILDLLDVPVDPRLQGQSMLPLALREGPIMPRVMPTEYGRSWGLRSRAFRYIVDYGGQELLYDVEQDPTEQREVKATRPLALRYFRDLGGIYLLYRTRWRGASWGTLNHHGPGFGR